MAYTVSEFLTMMNEQKSGKTKDVVTICSNLDCSVELSQSEIYLVDDQPHCEDCYWDEFSDILEKHPVGLPGAGFHC